MVSQSQRVIPFRDGKTLSQARSQHEGRNGHLPAGCVNEDIKVDSECHQTELAPPGVLPRQVAILCKDVKVSTDGMERLYWKARRKVSSSSMKRLQALYRQWPDSVKCRIQRSGFKKGPMACLIL
jgi:hypothetical protein